MEDYKVTVWNGIYRTRFVSIFCGIRANVVGAKDDAKRQLQDSYHKAAEERNAPIAGSRMPFHDRMRCTNWKRRPLIFNH